MTPKMRDGLCFKNFFLLNKMKHDTVNLFSLSPRKISLSLLLLACLFHKLGIELIFPFLVNSGNIYD